MADKEAELDGWITPPREARFLRCLRPLRDPKEAEDADRNIDIEGVGEDPKVFVMKGEEGVFAAVEQHVSGVDPLLEPLAILFMLLLLLPTGLLGWVLLSRRNSGLLRFSALAKLLILLWLLCLPDLL